MPDKMTNQSAEHLIRRMLNAYHFNEDTTESLIEDMALVFNKLNDIPSTKPPALSFLSEAQAKAIARVMEASPVLISEDDSSAVYAVHTNSYSESILAHFGRWQEQHICQTKMELTSDGATTYRLEASRVSFPEHDLCKMDALCKAWIQFRVKMEQDVKNREEAPANDDLGDLREHPF